MADLSRTALDVIVSELSPLNGKTLLDIGCGSGALSRPLQEAGAVWRGIDPHAQPGDPSVDIAPAEAMPYADKTFDCAICVNALHHVPVAAMGTALTEAARVLRAAARLVVIEPRASGALSQVIAVVDDETAIRHAAQTAMDHTCALRQVAAYDYMRTERYGGFDEFCDGLIAVDPARAARISTRKADLRRAFERHALLRSDLLTLSQPMSVRVFQRGPGGRVAAHLPLFRSS